MARRVLVGGAGGFIGRQIVAALDGLGAVAVVPPQRHDLLSAAGRAAFLEDADTLILGAWVTQTGAFWTSEANFDWMAATLDLARLFRARGGRRIVLVGSCAEYDWSPAVRAPWDEHRACRPHSLYGAAKLATWTALTAYARQTGMTAATSRVFLAAGRHEAAARLLPGLIRAAATGAAMATGPGELTREFCDVRDVGRAIAHVALSPLEGAVNIGAGRAATLRELAALIPGAERVTRFGARPPPPGEPLWMVPEGARLRLTGFTPRFTLADTVADALAYWRQDALVAA